MSQPNSNSNSTLVISFGRKGHPDSQTTSFSTDIVRIGSIESNDICIESKYIAGEAAVLTRQKNNWELFVLSETEVKVDDQPICGGERTLISRNTELEIFPYSLKLILHTTAETQPNDAPVFESVEKLDSCLMEYATLAASLLHDKVSRVIVNSEGAMLLQQQEQWENQPRGLQREQVAEIVQILEGRELEDGSKFETIKTSTSEVGFSITKQRKTEWVDTDAGGAAAAFLEKCLNREARILVCGTDGVEVRKTIVQLAEAISNQNLVVANKGLLGGKNVFGLTIGKAGWDAAAIQCANSVGASYLVIESFESSAIDPLVTCSLQSLRGLLAGVNAGSTRDAFELMSYQLCKATQMSLTDALVKVCSVFDFVVCVGNHQTSVSGIIEVAEPNFADGELELNQLLVVGESGKLVATGNKPFFGKKPAHGVTLKPNVKRTSHSTKKSV